MSLDRSSRVPFFTGFVWTNLFLLVILSSLCISGSTKSTNQSYSLLCDHIGSCVKQNEAICYADGRADTPFWSYTVVASDSIITGFKYIPPKDCRQRDYPYGIDSKKEWLERKIEKALPEEYDHRKTNGSMCPSIREISNQGTCNSCWAVVATDVMTDRLCLWSKGKNQKRISSGDLLTCCRDMCVGHVDNSQCDRPGMHRKAWEHWVQNGIVTGHYNNSINQGCKKYDIKPCIGISEEEWKKRFDNHPNKECVTEYMYCPSITAPLKCVKKCEDSSTEYREDRVKGKACYSLKRKFDGKESVIKAEIMLNGPVHGLMKLYSSFFKEFPKMKGEPIYYGPIGNKTTDSECGGHSIRIVGWGKKKDGEKERNYWIVANSYGDKWGNEGFFYLDFDHDNHKDVDSGKKEVFAGIPDLNYKLTN